MRLYYSQTSPYARKIRVVIAEKGLEDQVDLNLCNPFENPESLRKINPLGKVPALILPEGTVLYDSRVIADYLDARSPRPALIPPNGAKRWAVLRQQALGDGITDAAVAMVMETRRPAAQQSTHWKTRWQSAIERALGVLETEISDLQRDSHLGQISIGCALGYLDFRLSDFDWRKSHPKTALWYADFAQRPSMRATAHEE
ncbi:MAG: glutathione S-transferase N-terminal domain-containing protein [Robiginitomaculum sp.]|nr:glutathione S-transferase N-terminal domain-containing protein [Robiginitomaculum sp.]MDQ7077427.1 glutathione S-transferase N-terminal domain-containing protein [Robiginitomaculum sp.]